jgi:membrane protease YdiL (CAAX protease family)
MRPVDLKKRPFLAIAALLLLVFLITRIPLKENLGASKFVSSEIEGIAIPIVLVSALVLIIRKLAIPHSYFAAVSPRVALYYVPALIFALLSAHRISLLLHPSGSGPGPGNLLLYGAARLSRAVFEEVLFRGAVFGLLLRAYQGSRGGVLKSSLISGALFGCVHIFNIWTVPGYDSSMAVTQVYAAFCLGVLYCTTYVKTRSLAVLSIIHFINNFFVRLDELGVHGKLAASLEQHGTIAEAIASNVLGLIFYGLPLLVGIYIATKLTRQDLDEFMGSVRQESRL